MFYQSSCNNTVRKALTDSLFDPNLHFDPCDGADSGMTGGL